MCLLSTKLYIKGGPYVTKSTLCLYTGIPQLNSSFVINFTGCAEAG